MGDRLARCHQSNDLVRPRQAYQKKMLRILDGDHREQTGLPLKERLSAELGNIIQAITEVLGATWDALARSRGNGA